MDFNELLDAYQEQIDSAINGYFEARLKDARAYHPLIGEVYSQLRAYVMRKGKRLMSVSTLLTYEGYTGKVDEKALRACVAVELYRHGILVHDDMADEDETRRGEPALHKLFGKNTALFAGNMLNALALELLSDLEPRAARSLLQDYQFVNESQILDCDFEKRVPSVEEWGVMASRRAASVFRATMLTGGLVAGAPEDELEKLKNAAFHIGTAFDIQDDIIGLYEQTNNDVDRSKKPLHICYAYQLDEGFGKVYEEGDVEEIRKKVRQCGALQAAKDYSKKHAEEAAKRIEYTKMSEKSKGFYLSFIDYITESLDWYE